MVKSISTPMRIATMAFVVFTAIFLLAPLVVVVGVSVSESQFIAFPPSGFSLRWYALAYIAGILIGWRLVLSAIRRPALWRDGPPMTAAQVEDLLTWMILGIILGGRLGFVLFYRPGYYLDHPAEILQIWSGGIASSKWKVDSYSFTAPGSAKCHPCELILFRSHQE